MTPPHLRHAPARLTTCLSGEDGIASITMLIIGAITILFAAALLGGGAIFAARAHGFDLAQSAARAGAQAIDTTTYRADGLLLLDPAAATQAARAVLAAADATGQIQVAGARITVTATSRQATPMLAGFGIRDIEVTATATAIPTVAPPA